MIWRIHATYRITYSKYISSDMQNILYSFNNIYSHMKIKIICISDSDKHFLTAINEYCKRLGKDIEIITLKPEKNWSHEQIIQKETEKIIVSLQKTISEKTPSHHIILLAKEGRSLSTTQFTHLIEKKYNAVFIIGWPYGVDMWALKHYIDDYIAFGTMTMPHGLAKLVLLEQIYRAKMIQEWRTYHY